MLQQTEVTKFQVLWTLDKKMINYLTLQVLQDQPSFGGNYHIPQPRFVHIRTSKSQNSCQKEELKECKAPLGAVLPQIQTSGPADPWISLPARSTELILPGLPPRNFPASVPVPHPQLCSLPPINGILLYKDIQPVFIRLVSDGASTISPGNFLQWLITVTVKTHTSILI